MTQCHRAQPATDSPAVELHQVSHGATLSMTCRKMPESPGLCDFHSSMPGGLHQLVDHTLASAGEEKRLLEIALEGEFPLPPAHSGCFMQFPPSPLARTPGHRSPLLCHCL